MAVHQRRLKLIGLSIGASQFECQVSNWQVQNNTADGDRRFTFCPDGEFVEDTDPDWALQLTFFADWRSAGISRYLQLNDGLTAAFTLDHYPDVPAEHVTWSGNVKIKAPSVGGEARTTETQEITLQCVGKPTFTPEVP